MKHYELDRMNRLDAVEHAGDGQERQPGKTIGDGAKLAVPNILGKYIFA